MPINGNVGDYHNLSISLLLLTCFKKSRTLFDERTKYDSHKRMCDMRQLLLTRVGGMLCLLTMGMSLARDNDPSTEEHATFPENGEVFLDDFGSGLKRAAFTRSTVVAGGLC